MSHLLRNGWFAGLLFPLAVMTIPARAADLDYPEPPPPPAYDRPVVEEEPPIVVERRVLLERPVAEERRVVGEPAAPYPDGYDRRAYEPRAIYARPASPPPYDEDIPYAEGPRPPADVPY